MKTRVYFATLQVLLLMGICLICASCGKGKEYGAFNEEQMQHIPLATQTSLPPASGRTMVLKVFSETITSDEVLKSLEEGLKPAAGNMDAVTFAAQARPYVENLIEGKIIDILLYQKARKAAPENIDSTIDKAVDGEISRFVASYRNNYALAESKIKEMGFDWRTFREYQKKLIMTQSFLTDKLKEEKRFSQQMLRDFYNEHLSDFCWEGEVGFSIIEIDPQKLTSSQLGENETAKEAAMRLAKEAVAKIRNGAEFAEQAKQFHGPLALIGGVVETVTIGKESLSEPYNTLESHAIQMQTGQVSQPIEIDGSIFVLKVDTLKQAGCEPFDNVQNDIRQMLTFEHRQQEYAELVKDLVLEADMVQMERLTDFCIRQAYARWGNQS